MANRNCFYDVGHRLQGFIEEGRCCDAEGRPVCRFTGEGRFVADEAGGPTVLYTLRMDGTITAGATSCVCARIRPDGLVFGAALHPGDEPLLGQFDYSALLQYCAVPPQPQAPVPTFLGCTPVGDWLFSLLLAGVVTALCLLLRVGLFDGLLPGGPAARLCLLAALAAGLLVPLLLRYGPSSSMVEHFLCSWLAGTLSACLVLALLLLLFGRPQLHWLGTPLLATLWVTPPCWAITLCKAVRAFYRR